MMKNNFINYNVSSSGLANYTSSHTVLIYDDIPFYNNISSNIAIENIMHWFLKKESMTYDKVKLFLYYSQSWYYSLKLKKMMNVSFLAQNNDIDLILNDDINSYKKSKELLNYDSKYVIHFNSDVEEILESVWLTYGNHSELSLKTLIMSESPYKKAILSSNKVFDYNDLRNFYLSIYSGE